MDTQHFVVDKQFFSAIDLESVYHVMKRKWFYFVHKVKNCIATAKGCVSTMKNCIPTRKTANLLTNMKLRLKHRLRYTSLFGRTVFWVNTALSLFNSQLLFSVTFSA